MHVSAERLAAVTGGGAGVLPAAYTGGRRCWLISPPSTPAGSGCSHSSPPALVTGSRTPGWPGSCASATAPVSGPAADAPPSTARSTTPAITPRAGRPPRQTPRRPARAPPLQDHRCLEDASHPSRRVRRDHSPRPHLSHAKAEPPNPPAPPTPRPGRRRSFHQFHQFHQQRRRPARLTSRTRHRSDPGGLGRSRTAGLGTTVAPPGPAGPRSLRGSGPHCPGGVSARTGQPCCWCGTMANRICSSPFSSTRSTSSVLSPSTCAAVFSR